MRSLSIPTLVLAAACGAGSTAPATNTPNPARPLPLASTGQPTAESPSGGDAGVTAPPEEPRATTASDAALKEDARAANTFTLKSFVRAKKTLPGGNVIISGTSLRQALAAAYVGARGTTAKEMATALALPDDPQKAADVARGELAEWDEARGKSAELSIATRLWADKSLALKNDYAELASNAFGAPSANVEFSKPEDARRTINAWISEKTQDKIPELLPQGSVDTRSRLVITNAIYFKGRWAEPFPKGATKDEPFKVDAKKSVSVPTMHLTDGFRLAQTAGVKVLEMPYGGSELAMLVVLPDEPSHLAKIEEGLTADTIEKWTAALTTARVNVALPRFGFRAGGPMSAVLQDLGMKTAFGTKADFKGMADPPASDRLQLNQVFHQTWVAVDEMGTEAAAATGVVMRTTSMVVGPVAEFKADHPFLFFVRDGKRGRILFAGRVSDPKAGS